MSARYFLRKRGAYYRPNSRGYTTEILEAGVYTEEEVAGYKAEPRMGVSVIPVGDMRDEIQAKIDRANETILAAQLGLAMIDGLGEAE